MKKTKVSHYISAKFSVGLFAVSSAMLVGGTFIPSLSQKVLADQYDAQVQQLQQQNANARAAVSGLQAQAATYQEAINQLQAQIDSLQASIDANVAQQAALQQQIVEAQAEIDQQKVFLSSDLKAMYVDGTPTTLEVLANSKNLSDFVDKQEYRTTVQNKLQDTLKKIADLQKQLKSKKAAVEDLLNQQRTQQAQLDSDRAKQQDLLNYNESQQADFTAQLRANNAQLAQIQAARAAALRAITGSGGRSAVGSPVSYKNFVNVSCASTGYSYCWAGYDQVVSDPWGLNYAKECVHFAADWLARNGHNVPNMAGSGNADHWAMHGTVVSNPQYGDVAYMPIAPVGHVGIVTGVNGDGTVHVVQMNWPIGGYASEMDLYITSGIQFIRF
jgi:peptidoglycan hydrolase CwlO-like protein